MKNKILYIALILTLGTLWSCNDDKPSGKSIFVDGKGDNSTFGVWLDKNFKTPYNIDFKYKYEEFETDLNYTLVPSIYEKSILMAKLMKHLCIDAYDEIVDPAFLRMHFPKVFMLIGSPGYKNNGTMILGTAEGGKKISMWNVNALMITIPGWSEEAVAAYLNAFYFHTVHHEFAHILHQKVSYSTDFEKITSISYVGDSWKDMDSTAAAKLGFISPYAAGEHREDFVEVYSAYVTSTAANWERMMNRAGSTGRPLLERKLRIVYDYMNKTWKINMDDLRMIILRRQKEIWSIDMSIDN